ncbi:Aminotransferase class V domain [Dillenia turbinata]|uniref:Aminotransferase class V domain n=1 Tax=Dillenia turbinata TaxID=194707 RepID=A0AAN8V6A2_9MAGN
MELIQLILKHTFYYQNIEPSHGEEDHQYSNFNSSKTLKFDNQSNHQKSFRTIVEMGVPELKSAEKKLSWLRSQIIGNEVEFDTPFGKRRLTYADTAASGRSLLFIENYIINHVLPLYGNTHTSDSYVGQRTTNLVHEASEYVKRCLGGGDDDALLFCGSGTTAAIKKLQEVMGIAIPSTLKDRVLKILRNEERWVVFVGPYEHHSNLLSWRQSLAEVVEIGLNKDGLIDLEDLREKLKFYHSMNRPIIGSFSACSNVSGIYTDTRALARLLHQFGGYACFDFAASGPYVDIDMRSGNIDGYDAIFLSSHKFLGGPSSPGILLMGKALYKLSASAPSTCGGGTVKYVNGFSEKNTLYLEDIEERENAGTPPIVQLIRAALAFWVKEYMSPPVIRDKEHAYIEKALKRLLPNPNISILGNTNAERQAILSFLVYSTSNLPFGSKKSENNINVIEGNEGLDIWREGGNKRDKPLHGPFVAKLLNDLFGIQARGGCACAGPYGHSLLGIDEPHAVGLRSTIKKGYAGLRPGWTRICFPYYMSNEEFEFILAAVELIAIYGQRFLTLYDYNWRTGDWTLNKKAFENVAGKENKLEFSCLSLSLEEMKFDRKSGNKDQNVERLNGKFSSYLETANCVASFLPKFPKQGEIPVGIDHDLLLFRV